MITYSKITIFSIEKYNLLKRNWGKIPLFINTVKHYYINLLKQSISNEIQ
jgi:hypothetical protein